jgi:hypothetical protein
VQTGALSRPIITELRIDSVSIGAEGAIRINGLKDNSRVPVSNGEGNNFMYQQVGVNADLDIKEGQKVVVGKVSINPNEAMFLVLTAKVAQ